MSATTVVLSAGPNGLGVTRSLYLKGIRPTVISRQSDDVVNYSRLPARKIVLPEKDTESALLQTLLALPQAAIVIPTSDWFVSFLAENSETLSQHIRFILPSPDIARMLIDKASETETVSSILPLPKTIQKLTDATALMNKLRLPVIVKPRSHQHMVLGSKNRILHDAQEVADFFACYQTQLAHLIAQEVVPGDDDCQWVCNCFFDHNADLVQAFSFNRLRLSPSHYGVTSYAVSKQNDEVIALSRKLGKALGYVGPAMVEFKFDSRDNSYKYIELNPRLGMCNYFDTSCGINNAYVYCQLLNGEVPDYSLQMKNDVIFVSLYEDFFSRRKDGESVRQILSAYLNDFFKPHVFIYHTWWDPAPSVRMLVRQLTGLLKALLRKVNVI